jgi:hypothetical protein
MKRVPFIFLFAVASVLACGPFVNDLLPIETVRPADLDAYATRGEIGIVRPRFARRYLVQAYRRMSGREPLAAVGALGSSYDDFSGGARERWSEVHARFAGSKPSIRSDRNIGDYQFIDNCLGDAYASAAQTLTARAEKYGAASPQVREWITAQDAVFANCSDERTVIPDAPSPSMDPLARADRVYQIAAANFYAMRYDEAVQRFRAIASGQASPWRAYGHYLAGRARLRQATIAKVLDRTRLAEAEAEFRLVLQDSAAASLHASAQGLLDRIALRARPIERLRVLSAALSTAKTADDQVLRDYEHLMDAALGDTTDYEFANVPDRAALAATSDMNDWIIVMQGSGAQAADRALGRWKQSGTLPWLAAALWKVPAASPDAPALLQAAARIDTTSPAFVTIAFLRVRLLALGDRIDEAHVILATLPSRTPGGSQPDEETVNLIDALRVKVARSMNELLAAAPRRPVSNRSVGWSYSNEEPTLPRDAVFDADAGVIFSERLPLLRLVEAATSTALPPRLRLRVASAAFARAWMLKRHGEARAMSPVLRQLSPSLAADLEMFDAAATPQEGHLAGLRLILRTPGLRAMVKGIEDEADYGNKELPRTFDHTFRRNWWCGFGEPDADRSDGASQVLLLIYPQGDVPYPAFLSKDEIAGTQNEWSALRALGPAPNYLAREAVKWATARPTDLDAAEALAHAVEGTRWGCTDKATTAASRTAFQTLHKLFPRTQWALKTRYWY